MTAPEDQKSLRLSFRLSAAEKCWLERQAKGAPLSAYVRHRLFGHGDFNIAAGLKSRPRKVRADRRELAQVLGLLGRSTAFRHLDDLAAAADSGSLAFTAETEETLSVIRDDIRLMKMALMKALGIRET